MYSVISLSWKAYATGTYQPAAESHAEEPTEQPDTRNKLLAYQQEVIM